MSETTKDTDGGVLRGIELTKRGWDGQPEMVCTYKPTILGAKQAASAFKSLSEKHPNAGYELRALVSVPREAHRVSQSDASTPEEAEARIFGDANGEPGL